MTEFLQPLAIALLVVIVPATGRLLASSIKGYFAENRKLVDDTRAETKAALDLAAIDVAEKFDTHRKVMLGELSSIKDTVTAIEVQTKRTNGRVTENASRIVELKIDQARLQGKEEARHELAQAAAAAAKLLTQPTEEEGTHAP